MAERTLTPAELDAVTALIVAQATRYGTFGADAVRLYRTYGGCTLRHAEAACRNLQYRVMGL